MKRNVQREALATALAEIAAPVTDCVPWGGRIDRDGYGRFDASLAHRHVYEKTKGPIPDGMKLDHICHDPAICKRGVECPHRRCVNPDHLEPVTHAENTARGNALPTLNASKTHCLRGHEFTSENTYRMKSGGRRCRACAVQHSANYRNRRAC